MSNPIHVGLLVFTLLFGYLTTNCQPIIVFDTSDVFVLSYFEYSGNPDSFALNSYRSIMVQNNNEITKLLKTGLTTYQYISPKRKKLITKIDNFVENNFIANIIIEIWRPYLHRWLFFLRTNHLDSSTNNKIMNEILFDSLQNRKLFEGGDDIADGRLIYQLNKIGNSSAKLKQGVYYMLLKMKISSMIIDDTKNNNRTQGRAHSFYFNSSYRSGTITFSTKEPLIYCQLIRMKDEKNRTLLALPYQFEMLQPYKLLKKPR